MICCYLNLVIVKMSTLTNMHAFLLICSLTQPEIFEELVKLVTTEPPSDVEEKSRFRYLHMLSTYVYKVIIKPQVFAIKHCAIGNMNGNNCL